MVKKQKKNEKNGKRKTRYTPKDFYRSRGGERRWGKRADFLRKRGEQVGEKEDDAKLFLQAGRKTIGGE